MSDNDIGLTAEQLEAISGGKSPVKYPPVKQVPCPSSPSGKHCYERICKKIPGTIFEIFGLTMWLGANTAGIPRMSLLGTGL